MIDDLIEVIKSTKKLKLLYVEDNIDARNSTISILEDFFDDILVAVDGADGLEKFKHNEVDLIITDINMPKLSGLSMIKKIREMQKDVSVLVFSAYNESDFFIDSIKLGVEGYLLKPIDFKQYYSILIKVVKNVESRKAEILLKQYKEIVDSSSIMVTVDTDARITYINDAFCDISEYSVEELIGEELLLSDEAYKTIRDEKKIWKGIVKSISKSGNPYYLDSTIKPILDINGEIIEYIVLRYNVTEIVNPLKRLNDLIDSSEVPIVALVKIENYDVLESFYGERIMQEIEDSFAEKLLDFMPKSSDFKNPFILRNGEYAFAKDRYLNDKNDDEIINDLKEFQNTVNKAHITVDDLEYDISVLMSFAYGNEALQNARYGIKKLLESKENFIFANDLAEQEHTQAQTNMSILRMVKTALENKKIISYFQPIINNKTGNIDKYESLVRLVDENSKIVSPFIFLNTAKKGKYYTQITEIVLENSFNALDITDKDITINLSVLDIENITTVEKLFTLLELYKNDAYRVVLELLEDEDVKDLEVIKSFITKVKKLGVKIAIDDFGAGYSNFERLLEYQPDILKIDGSLIKNIATDTFSLSIARTMVSFAKEQNIKVVAEYVENEEIYNLLCSLGVDYSQGYYFGKPELLV